MRRAFLANLIILSALGLGASGCTCGSEKKKEEAPAGEVKPEAGKQLDPSAARKRTEALRKMRLAPVTLEEVEPLIPKMPGASPVGKPGVMTEGRQVKAVLCMVSPSADAAMTQLVAAVGALGFTDVKTRLHPSNQEMVTMHGEKQPFQLGAVAQKSRTPDCPGDQGKIKVVLSYFKRVTTDGASPAPAP